MLTTALTLAIIAVVLALFALAIAMRAYTDQRAAATVRTTRAPRALPPQSIPPPEEPESPPGPAAFIINPAKVSDVGGLQETARNTSRELGLPEPMFYETTPEEPGRAQASQALAAGASVVVAAGGDGTVRAVATAMAGTGVPMALVPAGTGNLLARNLDLPLGLGPAVLVQTALSGREMAIDLGWIMPIAPGMAAEDGVEEAFLVMAGTGFDAQMVAGADDDLKRRIGWFAYFAVGMRHLLSRKTRLTMRVGNGAWQSFRLRTMLIANCGRLPGGILLLPDAELDDGYLDVAAIDTRGGLFGWAQLAGRVMLQGMGIRPRLPYEAASIAFWRGRSVTVQLEQPEPVQVDGDLVGEAVEIRTRIQEAGLRVRVHH